MSNKFYKYYVGLTSQIFFCSIPFRLDPYNHCQFDCAYCFAKNRGGFRGKTKLLNASPETLKKRLTRIQNGVINSAVDEFFQKRIPIQMGGMSDPFSPIETTRNTTRNIIKILADFNYPTIINTKNTKFFKPELIEVLKTGNFYVRFSVSMVDEKIRAVFEKTTSTFDEILWSAANLLESGVSASIRFQPIFPKYENDYLLGLKKIARFNIPFVSFEFLKLASDMPKSDFKRMDPLYDGNIFNWYQKVGCLRLGREYVLPVSYKLPFLKSFKEEAHSLGILVGLAENEFLHLSDGNSCCSGADLFLKDCNIFKGNIQAILRKKETGEIVEIEEVFKEWLPKENIGTYLNSQSRLKSQPNQWENFIKRDWNVNRSPYSPAFYYGIKETGQFDKKGFKKYFVEDRF